MSRPHCQISILYVGNEVQEYHINDRTASMTVSEFKKNPVVYRLQSSYKTNPEPINMFFCQKLLFTVTCLAVVALIHMMTVQFYFHDTTTAVTKLHVKQRMFGKCKPQISRMLRKTITQGTRRKNKQKRSV